MNPAKEHLLSLPVRNVMQRSVMQISASDRMSDAAASLVKHSLTAAPVVDEHGRCCGLLSATDFVRCEAHKAEPDSTRGSGHVLVPGDDDEPIHIDDLCEGCVGDHMSQGVQGISANTTILEAGRIMSAGQFHHIPVIDDAGRAIGVISPLDIVSEILKAENE